MPGTEKHPECRTVRVKAGNVSVKSEGLVTLAREQFIEARLLDVMENMERDSGESGDVHSGAMVDIYTFK